MRRFADLNPVVIPLPIASCAGLQPDTDRDLPSSTTHPDIDIAIVGFIYPGKGHEQALRALTGLPSSVGLKAIGRPADTHDAMTGQLMSLARSLERRFTVIGFLAEPALLAEMRSTTVPVAAHHRIAASGSICAWLGAGRRPLVPDGPWTRELQARCPGSVTLYRATGEGLADAIAAVIGDPSSTWLAPHAMVGPDPAEAAALYAAASRFFLGSNPAAINRGSVG